MTSMRYLKILCVILLGLLWVPLAQGQGEGALILHNDLNSTKWTNTTITTAIHNETLSAYTCNSTGMVKIYDDFTTWIESDGVNRLSETETRVTFSNLGRPDIVWLRDSKTGELQTFVIEFQIKLTSISSASATIRFNPLTISNWLDSYSGNKIVGRNQFGIQLRSWSSTTGYNLLLFETVGTTLYYKGDTSNRLTKNIQYYVRLSKSSTSLTLKVDDDSDFSSPINSYSLTLHSNYNYNYILMPQSAEMATPYPSYGYMEYLWFGDEEGGYSSGYLFTEDLLQNYTGDQPFSLIHNVSLNDQTLNVSVSENGSSWSLVSDYNSDDGYLVSYLEPFNYSSLYVRYGFETDKTDTPILYDYHLTLYHEAVSGGISLEFGDINWILTVIWVALLGIGWGSNVSQFKVLGGVFGMVVGIYFLAEDTLIGLLVVFLGLILFMLSVRMSR